MNSAGNVKTDKAPAVEDFCKEGVEEVLSLLAEEIPGGTEVSSALERGGIYCKTVADLERNFHAHVTEFVEEKTKSDLPEKFAEVVDSVNALKKKTEGKIAEFLEQAMARLRELPQEAKEATENVKRIAREVTGKENAELRETSPWAWGLSTVASGLLISLALWLEITLGKVAIAMGTTEQVGIAMAIATALVLATFTILGARSLIQIRLYKDALKHSKEAREPSGLTNIIFKIAHITLVVTLLGIGILRAYVIFTQEKSWANMAPVLMLIVIAGVFYGLELFIFTVFGGHPAKDVKRWKEAKGALNNLKTEYSQLREIMTHSKAINIVNEYTKEYTELTIEKNKIVRLADRINRTLEYVQRHMAVAGDYFIQIIKRVSEYLEADEDALIEKFNRVRPIGIPLQVEKVVIPGDLPAEIDFVEAIKKEWGKRVAAERIRTKQAAIDEALSKISRGEKND